MNNIFGSRLRSKGKQPKHGFGTLPVSKPNKHRSNSLFNQLRRQQAEHARVTGG